MLVAAPILIPVAALRGPEASVQAVKTCDSPRNVCAEAGAGCGQADQWLGCEVVVAGVSCGAIGLIRNILYYTL